VVPLLQKELYETELRELIELQYIESCCDVHKYEALSLLRDLLLFAGDTFSGMEKRDANELFAHMGFERIANLPYVYTRTARSKDNEELDIWLDGKDGILLTNDTTDTDFLMKSIVHFNWISKHRQVRPSKLMLCEPGTSITEEEIHDPETGELHAGVWAVTTVLTDGMHYRLGALRQNGAFIWPWIIPPAIKVLHRQDEEDMAKLTPTEKVNCVKERLQMIPPALRKAMGIIEL